MAKKSITLTRTDSLNEDLDRLHELIRQRAYEIFMSRNGRTGSDLNDWLLAEKELVVRPAIELRERDGHIELEAVVTSGDPTELEVRVGPQDILISLKTASSRARKVAQVQLAETAECALFGSVHLPTRIDPTTAAAEWRDGLLHLTAALASETTTASEIRPGSEA